MKSFRAVVEDSYGCFEMWAKASISLSEKLFVLGSPVILILQHYNIFAFDIDMEICYWRKFEWSFYLRKALRDAFYTVWNLINGQSWTKIQNATVDA